MDDAFCGGGDNSGGGLSSGSMKMIKAAIFMGDPRHIPGLPYNVGTCKASGVSYPAQHSLQKCSIYKPF
jgi:acetylxylan esterase